MHNLSPLCTQVRRDIIRMVASAQSGHPGGSLGCVEYMVTLYFQELRIDPAQFNIDGTHEDLFFLSNGHISPLWYSVLSRRGYFSLHELSTFRQLNSRLQGHPATKEHLPGVRVASGSLGQGLSVAIGAALAKKLNNDSCLVYSLHGDGELQEGQIWEAAMFAAARGIDNLISAVDYNRQQIDGPVGEVMDLGNLRAKWEAFGWLVLECKGNDLANVSRVLQEAKLNTGQGKPIVILLHTEMGMGVDFMTGTHEWHGKPTNDEQTARALSQLPETIGDY